MGDLCSILGLGSSGERKGYPLQYCGLENSMDYRVHGVTKSQTWLSSFHFTSLHLFLHVCTKALEVFASLSFVVIYDCCLICFFEYSELEYFSVWLSLSSLFPFLWLFFLSRPGCPTPQGRPFPCVSLRLMSQAPCTLGMRWPWPYRMLSCAGERGVGLLEFLEEKEIVKGWG